MAMGYGCNFGMIISKEDVIKIVPDEFKALLDKLEGLDITLDTLAQAIQYDDVIAEESVSDEEAAVVDQLWKEVEKAFEKRTGIELELHYHDKSSEGDHYDEVDGAYFELSWQNVMKLSPEADALKKQGIQFGLRGWVSYG